MNAALIVGIVVVALLALVFVFSTLSRRDSERAIGFLNRESRARDRGNPLEQGGAESAVVSGRDIERAAVLERRGGALVVVEPPPPPRLAQPPDAEANGVTRL